MRIVLLYAAGILLFIVLVVLGYFKLFDDYYFSMNGATYKPSHVQGNVIHYSSYGEPSIEVEVHDQNRRVFIGSNEYLIYKDRNQFEVVYPNGKEYRVSGSSSGSLTSYDDNGRPIFPSVYMNGKRVMGGSGELYSPSSVVAAAYSEFHTRQGSRALYVVSILSFVFSWCSFRYEGFQTFLFDISPERLSYKDPVPSEFYYYMCKAGGIGGMVVSVILLMASVVQ